MVGMVCDLDKQKHYCQQMILVQPASFPIYSFPALLHVKTPIVGGTKRQPLGVSHVAALKFCHRLYRIFLDTHR